MTIAERNEWHPIGLLGQWDRTNNGGKIPQMQKTASALVILSGLWASTQGQGVLNSLSAKRHVGESATVCGHAIRYECFLPLGTSITFATNDDTPFKFRIPYADREKFGRNPEDQYLNRIVCATGLIEKREKHHEIVITDPKAIAIRPDLPGLPPFHPDLHRPCHPDVRLPKVTRDAKPQYTAGAMRAGVQGGVLIQTVVEADGRVGDLRVIRSLHEDLDAEAIRAARQWLFEPGTFMGQPTPVVVTIEMTFTLRK